MWLSHVSDKNWLTWFLHSAAPTRLYCQTEFKAACSHMTCGQASNFGKIYTRQHASTCRQIITGGKLHMQTRQQVWQAYFHSKQQTADKPATVWQTPHADKPASGKTTSIPGSKLQTNQQLCGRLHMQTNQQLCGKSSSTATDHPSLPSASSACSILALSLLHACPASLLSQLHRRSRMTLAVAPL